MSALALTFASPLILFGLLSLPVIWWLLRLTPPRPKEEVFPPTRILAELGKREETPAHSPWWLTLLRLAMAACVILALAEPIWNANDKQLRGNGPLLVVLDDTWASAPEWEARKAKATALIEEAESADRPVALALVSEGAKTDLTTVQATGALGRLAAAEPKPVRADYTGLAEKISTLPQGTIGEWIWLHSGLESTGVQDLLTSASGAGLGAPLLFNAPNNAVVALTKVNNTPEALEIEVERMDTSADRSGIVTAFDEKGRSIATAPFSFESDDNGTVARFELPVELRNEVFRVAVSETPTAGGVQLLDDRFKRRRVGLISGGNADQEQPLLSPVYFIQRALAPFSDVRQPNNSNLIEAIADLFNENISTLVLADIGTMPAETTTVLEEWVEKGGLLVRFAGPRLAAAENDTLVPVELRRGGRSLGGTLTWGTPQPLASFDPGSPFNGITVPNDVTVSRQVLAQPGIDLTEKTWASLEDGTPLVTASQRGSGWIVLFHVTADSSWSNLPLSGAFVDMLRRIVAVSNGSIAAEKARTQATGQAEPASSQAVAEVTLPPLRVLNGFGAFTPPSGEISPVKISAASTPPVTLENPPGLYGTSDAFTALNLFNGPTELTLFNTSNLPAGSRQETYSTREAFAFKPWLLAAALVLLALDCLAVLWMAGALRRRVTAAAAMLLVVFFLAPLAPPAMAQEASAETTFDYQNTLRTRIAYVVTGDSQLDNLSRKGLTGLTNFISSRTSLEPAPPVGVDISKDELSFYPLIYWPISTSATLPNAAAMARLDAFMKKGGSVLFDTRDQLSGGFGGRSVTAETQRLRQILASLDIPPLEPVPDNHVLTRAFYLLNVFPGRYLEGRLWVETSEPDEENVDRPARPGDGVSSIMITSNDMAGAWATEADGSPSLPVVPPNPRQRVFAYRTGVNIMMYTLTGNYKSDQVHIPALLERLGQ